MCVGLLVEEEEVSVSKIFRREKGYRSFVRLSLTAIQLKPVVRLLVFSLADIGEPFKERCIVTSLQRLFGRLEPEVFFGVTPIVGRKKSCPCGRHRISVLLEKGRRSPCARTAHNANITPSSPSSSPPKKLPQSHFKAKTSTFLSDAPFPKSEYFFSLSKDSVQA